MEILLFNNTSNRASWPKQDNGKKHLYNHFDGAEYNHHRSLVLGQEQQQKRTSGSALNFSSISKSPDFSCRLKLQEDLSSVPFFTTADDATPFELTREKFPPLELFLKVSTVVGSSVGGDTRQFSASKICRICRISPKINLEIFST